MTKWIIPFLFALIVPAAVAATPPENTLQYQSALMRVELAPDQPALVSLAVDSLARVSGLFSHDARILDTSMSYKQVRLLPTGVDSGPGRERRTEPSARYPSL